MRHASGCSRRSGSTRSSDSATSARKTSTAGCTPCTSSRSRSVRGTRSRRAAAPKRRPMACSTSNKRTSEARSCGLQTRARSPSRCVSRSRSGGSGSSGATSVRADGSSSVLSPRPAATVLCTQQHLPEQPPSRRGRERWQRRRLSSRKRSYTESISLFQQTGNDVRRAVAYANLAAIAAESGDPASAVEHGTRAIALQRENGDVDGLGVSLANLARVQLTLGDDSAARLALGEAMGIAQRIGYQLLLAYGLGAAAELAARDGEPARAARLIGASRGLFEAIAMPFPDAEADEQERTLAAIRPPLGSECDELVTQGRIAAVDEMIADALELTR
ncbi:MAG: tetratricopeptide repeat protein [Chloroflexi bacterium]|nr:MAG: tetratricopeptide repeat protein [Chloroflexota bacterium]